MVHSYRRTASRADRRPGKESSPSTSHLHRASTARATREDIPEEAKASHLQAPRPPNTLDAGYGLGIPSQGPPAEEKEPKRGGPDFDYLRCGSDQRGFPAGIRPLGLDRADPHALVALPLPARGLPATPPSWRW